MDKRKIIGSYEDWLVSAVKYTIKVFLWLIVVVASAFTLKALSKDKKKK